MSRLYWIVAAAALLLLLVLKVFHLGYNTAVSERLALDSNQLRKAFEQGQELGTVRDNVVTEYVDRVQVIKERGATIIKEVPVYVSAKADAACVVNAGFVRVHDAAAGNLPAPEPSGAADEAPSGIALSTVAATSAGNYATCNETAERLTRLQEYVREYEKSAWAASDTP